MLEFLKHKLYKIGCFALIAVTMIIVTAAAKLVLGWMHFDGSSQEVVSKQIGEHFGKGILGLLLIAGLIAMWREHTQRKNASALNLPQEGALGPLKSKADSNRPSEVGGQRRIVSDAASTSAPPIPRAKGSKLRGCIIYGIGLMLLVMIMAIGGCWWLAGQYDTRPKKPGESELMAIKEDTMSYRDSEGFGNNELSRKLATNFARSLRTSRQFLFTKGDESSVSLSKGHFITYCNNRDGLCAFVVHIPEFRHYTKDAQLTMSELAWTVAVQTLNDAKIEPKELAVGVRGIIDYAWIFTGTIVAPDSISGIKERHDGRTDEPLYRFFVDAPRPFAKPPVDVPSVKQVEQVEQAGSKAE